MKIFGQGQNRGRLPFQVLSLLFCVSCGGGSRDSRINEEAPRGLPRTGLSLGEKVLSKTIFDLSLSSDGKKLLYLLSDQGTTKIVQANVPFGGQGMTFATVSAPTGHLPKKVYSSPSGQRFFLRAADKDEPSQEKIFIFDGDNYVAPSLSDADASRGLIFSDDAKVAFGHWPSGLYGIYLGAEGSLPANMSFKFLGGKGEKLLGFIPKDGGGGTLVSYDGEYLYRREFLVGDFASEVTFAQKLGSFERKDSDPEILGEKLSDLDVAPFLNAAGDIFAVVRENLSDSDNHPLRNSIFKIDSVGTSDRLQSFAQVSGISVGTDVLFVKAYKWRTCDKKLERVGAYYFWKGVNTWTEFLPSFENKAVAIASDPCAANLDSAVSKAVMNRGAAIDQWRLAYLTYLNENGAIFIYDKAGTDEKVFVIEP